MRETGFVVATALGRRMNAGHTIYARYADRAASLQQNHGGL